MPTCSNSNLGYLMIDILTRLIAPFKIERVLERYNSVFEPVFLNINSN